MTCKNLAFAFFLIIIGIGERVIFDLGPNIELVTLSSLLASCYLGFPYAVIVPLAIMSISDILIGNTMIFIFTWSAYIFIGLAGLLLRRFQNSGFRLPLLTLPAAFTSSLFFYLWTNFGVWLQGWYPPTLQGLITSYVMGLPFFKLNLWGNLLLVPLGFMTVELGKLTLLQPAIQSKKLKKRWLKILLITKRALATP